MGKGVVENVLFSSSLKQSMIGSGARGKTHSKRPSRFKALRGCPIDKDPAEQQSNMHTIDSTNATRLERHDIDQTDRRWSLDCRRSWRHLPSCWKSYGCDYLIK